MKYTVFYTDRQGAACTRSFRDETQAQAFLFRLNCKAIAKGPDGETIGVVEENPDIGVWNAEQRQRRWVRVWGLS